MAIVQERYYVSTALPTTLASALGASGNPSVVSIPGTWPTSYPFPFSIDWGTVNAEQCLATGPPAGSGPYTIPCLRGQDNTLPTSHAGPSGSNPGALVVHGESSYEPTLLQQLLKAIRGRPWEFSVLNYGAVGDGQLITDAVISASGASLTTLTSTPFAPIDATNSKAFILNGAGSATFNGPLIGTISAYVADNQVTVSAAATTAVSGACLYWGTDDTVAFLDAFAAALAWIQAGNPKARVLIPFPPNGLFYMVAGSLITTGNANAQIPVPYIDDGGSTQKGTLEVEWMAGDGSTLELWSQTQAQVAGAVVSTGMYSSAAAYTTNYNANGDSCVFGSTPNFPAAAGSSPDDLPGFSNIHAVFINPKIVCPANDFGLHYSAINLSGCATGRITNPSALVSKTYYNSGVNTGPNKPVSASGLATGYAKGFILPSNGNNDQAVLDNPTVSGFTYGFLAGEHALVKGGRVIRCWTTMGIVGHGDNQTEGEHLIKVIGLSSEDCTAGIQVIGAGEAGGIFCDIEIDTEGFSSGQFISDTTSGTGLANLYGEIRTYGAYSNNIFGPEYPVSFRIRSFGGNGSSAPQAPGWQFAYTGFSVAGTTVAVQNPEWRPARVYFSGGTISAVGAGVTNGGTGGSASTAPLMTATGLSGSGVVNWPSGGWLAFTFTGSPVWNICWE